MEREIFISSVGDMLMEAIIDKPLSKGPAVILERIARGGGATKWYYCRNIECLELIFPQFRPGSMVSFYFDGRIKYELYRFEIGLEIQKILEETGEMVVGLLSQDQIHIETEILTDFSEFVDFSSHLESGVRIFFGTFPGRDNDGRSAVTLILPDLDGVVRSHPH